MLGMISYNYCNEIIGRARVRLHTNISGGEKCGEVKERVSGNSKRGPSLGTLWLV